MKNGLVTLLCTAAGLLSIPAFAVDGLKLINQAAVVAAGGYPYVISQPGSYQLSGNLSVTATAFAGIQITTSNVTLDLNGFAILCSGGETIAGIEATSSTGAYYNNIQVKNGKVSACGNGVLLFYGSNSDVESMLVSGYGTSASGGHLVYGIAVFSGTIRNNNLSSNGNSGGIYLGSGVISSNNLSGDEIGIYAGQTVVTGNSVSATSTGLLVTTSLPGYPLVGTNIFYAPTAFAASTVLSQHNNFCNNTSC